MEKLKQKIQNEIRKLKEDSDSLTVVGEYSRGYLFYGNEQDFIKLLANECHNANPWSYMEDVKGDPESEEHQEAYIKAFNKACDKAVEALDYNVFDGDIQKVTAVKDADLFYEDDELAEAIEDAKESELDSVKLKIYASASINGGYASVEVGTVEVGL